LTDSGKYCQPEFVTETQIDAGSGAADGEDSDSGARTRTYTWGDPMTAAAALGRSNGLETLRAFALGSMPPPPISRTLAFEVVDVREGFAAVTMLPLEFHYNPLGSVHGGVIATLLDTAAGCAVHTTLDAGQGYTSLDLTTKFLRPVTLHSGQLRGEGTVVARTRQTALAEARLVDAAGRLVAHATSSCLIFNLPV
jgi:uncharacterized protein (TIGR00369 family)